MKIKKFSALILAGMLTCMTPAAVQAQDVTEIAEQFITDNQIDSLLEDPDKVVDIVMYVKNQIDEQDVSDDDILSVIQLGEQTLNIDLSDEEEQSLLKIVKKVKDMDIDEEKLRSQITSIYDKLDELGVDKQDVKNILEKAIDFVKSFLN